MMASELRRRRASYERHDHREFGLLCIRVWFSFALYWVFFFFFFLINTYVLKFVLLLLCIDCIGVWFSLLSLPTMWSWIWFLILCVFFFLRICGWVCYLCNLLGLSWVWLCYNFFFFFRFYFNFFFDIFFLLESWTDIYLYIYIYIKFEGVPNTD